jgi:hypothetical protein
LWTLGILLVVAILRIIARIALKNALATSRQPGARRLANMGGLALALLIVGAVLWRAMSLAASDRMPRQDVAGSPIYDRTNSLITDDKKYAGSHAAGLSARGWHRHGHACGIQSAVQDQSPELHRHEANADRP